jgi:hypothetical protein
LLVSGPLCLFGYGQEKQKKDIDLDALIRALEARSSTVIIKGRLFGEDGKPVPAVLVTISCPARGALDAKRTGQDGVYEFNLPKEEMFELTYLHSTLSTQPVTQLAGNANLDISKVLVQIRTAEAVRNQVDSLASALAAAIKDRNSAENSPTKLLGEAIRADETTTQIELLRALSARLEEPQRQELYARLDKVSKDLKQYKAK